MAKAFRIKIGLKQKGNTSYVPKPEPPSLPNVVPDRVKQHIKYNFNPVLEDQETPMRKIGGGSLKNIPEHVSGVYRFKDSDDEHSLLDSIESKVVADANWFMVETHECDHDKPDSKRTGCGDWIVERQNTPPKSLPKKYVVKTDSTSLKSSNPEPSISTS